MCSLNFKEIINLTKDIDIIYSMSMGQREAVYDCAAQLGKGDVALEIGICRGITTSVLTYVAKEKGFETYGIDDWSLGNSEEEFRATLEELGLETNIITGRSQDVEWEKEIDLLIIDGCHIPEMVKLDYEKFIPFVKSGGVVMSHDWVPGDDGTDHTNAHWGINFYGEENMNPEDGWELLGNVVGLEIRRKP